LGKCCGLHTTRKLQSHHSHLGTVLKANPFRGVPCAKRIILENISVYQEWQEKKAFVFNDRCSNFIEVNVNNLGYLCASSRCSFH
uniref:Uncharacterized protein n=1 Tax=Salvator merianae TaxID=96440 RepID=A0A8D0BI47_SALMN